MKTTGAKQWLKRVAYVAVAAGLAAGITNTARSAGKEGPRAVDVAEARRVEQPRGGAEDVRAVLPPGGRVGAAGTVEPLDREVRLTTQVPGVVAEVLVEEGQRVAAGAPLVRLSGEVEAAAVAAAEADVSAANAALSKVLRGARVEELKDAEAQAEAARARAAQSAVDARRAGELAERGAASPDERDRAAAQAAVDAKQAAAAEARWKSLANGSRREDVLMARAQLAQAEARLASARAALGRLTLVAPAAGEVLEVLVRPGEYLNPAAGNAAITMGDTSKVRVRLQVDERDVGRITVGQAGWVVAEAYGSERFPGRVVDVGRRMGRKRLVTQAAGEKLDTQVLDVILELEGQPPLVQGLRVTGYLEDARGRE